MSKYFRPWNIDQTLMLPPGAEQAPLGGPYGKQEPIRGPRVVQWSDGEERNIPDCAGASVSWLSSTLRWLGTPAPVELAVHARGLVDRQVGRGST
jgi:hypothetical protein